jgi:hypothetical protein
MPREAKAYLTYQDQWEWDFKDCLISLGVSLRDATSDKLLASAYFIRPTAFMKTPAFMVQTVLDGLLNPSAKSALDEPPVKPTDGVKSGGGRHRD